MKDPIDPAKTAPYVRPPTATATIGPMGRRAELPREHMISVTVQLSADETTNADKVLAAAAARRSLGAYAPGEGEPDRRSFRDVCVSRKVKGGSLRSVVVGVEGSVVWPERPLDDSVEALRSALAKDGYQVVVQERRECAEERCASDAMVDWRRPDDVPARWFSNVICGKHDYRRCSKCKSVYHFTCANAAGQAPAVHCEVCGRVLVEWGASKVWQAELVTRGAAP